MIKRAGMILVVLSIIISCGGGESEASKEPESPKTNPDGITQDQVNNGIGPISAFTLGPLDESLAEKGQGVFDIKCVACHKTNERLVGPALGGVTERRSPAFIMNMILNPDEMVKKHPTIKALLAEYYVPMTFQNVTENDARAILEYLRTQGSPASQDVAK